MSKKIFFLSGFPRAGNTILASILNQNEDIYATGRSVTPDIFLQLNKIKETATNFKYYPNNQIGLNNVYANIFNNFYLNVNKKYIIERGDWVTPYNYLSLKEWFEEKPKIIVLVRDIIDIIKSYLSLCSKHPDFHINLIYNSLDKTTLYKSDLETKIEIITNYDGIINRIIYGINWLKKEGYDKDLLFINYDDIIDNPNQTLKKIYSYLEIPFYKHKFSNFKHLNYNDSFLDAPMHDIRTDKLSKMDNKVKIPKSIIKKYEDINKIILAN
jgi:sulfotransferase